MAKARASRLDNFEHAVDRYFRHADFKAATFKEFVKRLYVEIRTGNSRPPPP